MLAIPGTARADDDYDPETEHLAFSMGFLGGDRNFSGSSFDLQGGAGTKLLGVDPREPFAVGKFGHVPVYGLRYDTRLVISHVRMTAGFDFPFANVGATHASIGGVDRTLAVSSFRPYVLRFGLGVEAPTERIVPFLDLLGSVHWTSATLALDGQSLDYKAVDFGWSLRGGVRVELRKAFFVTAAGEVGLGGPVRWTAELGVGFRSF